MQSFYARLLNVSLVTLSLYACGANPGSNLNLRQQNISGLDGFGVAKVDFYFNLPNRKLMEGADGVSLLTGFYYRMEGSGDKCLNKETFEATIAYDDDKFIGFPISGGCDYKLTLKAGSLAAPAEESKTGLTASHSVNFQNDIRPLIEKSCASCHATYVDYASFRQIAAQAVLDVEAGTQPPTGPLPDAEIATFLAWQDAGFPEVDDGPVATVEEQKLSEVYYRNNNDDTLFAHELLGRSFYELLRPLWIQPEGQAQGFSSKHVTLSERLDDEQE